MTDRATLTLPELLAAHRCDDLALADLAGNALSHSALSETVAGLAAELAQLGVERSDEVLFLCDNGPAAAIGFLAIASAAIARPVNPGLPTAQLREAFARTPPKAVVATPGGLAQRAREAGADRLILLEPLEGPLAFRLSGGPLDAPPASPPGSPAGSPAGLRAALAAPAPEDDALVLQSSGTTGRPKTIRITHANLVLSAANIQRCLDLGPSDRAVNAMPLFHIHGLLAGLLAPLVGGGAVMASPGLDPDAFLDWAVEFGATWHTGAPTMHQAILAAAERRPADAPLPPFRFLRSSSSELPAAVRAGVARVFGCPMVEAYGMTEATHQMTSQRPSDREPRHGSVGRATGIEVGVVDPDGPDETVRLVGPGEVVIRGATVARVEGGAPRLAGGWMRTGDLGRLSEDGELSLTGRLKEIVKRGGFQIAPREVEDALLAIPGVAAAVAFGAPHETLGQDLAAAVQARPGVALDQSQLRRALFDRLAPYQVPSRILVLDRIPLGATGKVQRSQMSALLADRLATPFAEPETPLEAVLVEIFEEVAPGRAFGRHDDFFFSGGDSLSGARAVARVCELFAIEIPVGTLFQAPNAAEYAAFLMRYDDGRLAALIDEALLELQAEPLDADDASEVRA
ncbi:MAG: AMP-binding protein [Pseudomonadota bacterium]